MVSNDQKSRAHYLYWCHGVPTENEFGEQLVSAMKSKEASFIVRVQNTVFVRRDSKAYDVGRSVTVVHLFRLSGRNYARVAKQGDKQLIPIQFVDISGVDRQFCSVEHRNMLVIAEREFDDKRSKDKQAHERELADQQAQIALHAANKNTHTSHTGKSHSAPSRKSTRKRDSSQSPSDQMLQDPTVKKKPRVRVSFLIVTHLCAGCASGFHL